MKLLLWSMVLISLISTANADLKEEEIEYKAGDVTLQGFLAYDETIPGKRPGILVVHEWWGHNEYARKRARMLADMGYIALAVDMYGDGKTASHPKEAGEFSSAVMKNMDVATARFKAALEVLKNHDKTQSQDIASIGYCFGGGIVLNMARSGVDLKGVVSFHGSLNTGVTAKAGQVKADVLVLHGADDKFIKPEAIEAFKQEMQQAKVDYKFIAYPDSVHAFTNPNANEYGKKFGIPLAYNAQADRLSWTEMQKFFNSLFIK